MPGGEPTIVLVHGAGHTSLVWRSVQDHLRHASVAVDLPGRRDRPADITRVSIDTAADSVADDVCADTAGRLVLVGHSAGGIVIPALAARLGDRVDHLVFVAGLSAPEGGATIDAFLPVRRDPTLARVAELRQQYSGHMLDPTGPANAAPAITDIRVAANIDSLNYITQVVSWKGVAPEAGRTFVRSLRDSIQPRELQAQLVQNCGATTVVDIDAGHTAALDMPEELARVLDDIADPHHDDVEG